MYWVAPLLAVVIAGFTMCTARAADLVLVGDGIDEQLAMLAVAKVGHADLDSVTLEGLLQGRAPLGLGGGIVVHACTDVPTLNAQVATHLAAAETSVSYGEFGLATGTLHAATTALGCLSEPVDPAQAARVHYLGGVIALARGETEKGNAQLRQAVLFDPKLTWDSNFPAEHKPLLDGAHASAARASPIHINVIPPVEVGILLDGVRATFDGTSLLMGEGTHLLQITRSTTVTISVTVSSSENERGPASLVIPTLVPNDAADWSTDPSRSARLSTLLTAVLGEGRKVYVVTQSALRSTTTGTSDWTTHGSGGPKVKQKRPAPVVTLTGGGLFVAGGAIAVVGWQQGRQIASDANMAPDRSTWDGHVAEHANARTLHGVGAGLAIGGAVMAVIGLATDRQRGVSLGMAGRGVGIQGIFGGHP